MDGDVETKLVHFSLVLIDDRLLHGRVVLHWIPRLRPRRIAIVDDSLAGDSDARALFKAVAPDDIALWIGSVGEAQEALLMHPSFPPSSTLVLLPSPKTARALFDAGVHYASLNVGCLVQQKGHRLAVRPQVHLSPDEAETLQYLASRGVSVSVRVLPSDRAMSLEAAMRRVLRHTEQRGLA